MKLVQQIQLHYLDDKSDKLYEVDLCEVGPGQFLVNFRYGRRGRPLKSGTRTDFPIQEAEARKVYQKLVDSKIKKGYREGIQSSPATAPVSPTPIVKEETKPIPNSPWALPPEHIAALLQELQTYLPASQSPTPPPPVEEAPSPKTDTPDPENIARDNSVWGIFRRLTGAKTPDKETPSTNIPRFENSKKEQNSRDKRSLSRLVWRMGELRIKDGVPFLLQLSIPSSTDDFLLYSLAWALGRCGDAQALPKIESLLEENADDLSLYCILQEAKLALLSGAEKTAFLSQVQQQLGPGYQSALKNTDAQAIINAIEAELTNAKQAYLSIARLYLLASANASIYQALSRWCGEVRLQGSGYFKSIRQLYKAAEFRDDFRLLGVLAYQIEKQASTFINNHYGGTHLDNQWVRTANEIKQSTSRLGFSFQSKAYFTRRSWRYLLRKGNLGDPSYVPLAVGLLLSYSDEDEKASYNSTRYEYGRDANGNWFSNSITTHYSPFASWYTLNEILYRNSPRYCLSKGRNKWIFKENHNASSPVPEQREEAFPELWDRQVPGILHLLAESRSRIVHEFAVKAARANLRTVLPLIDADFLTLLLNKEYKVSTHFGLELARLWYRADAPSIPLLQALLNTSLVEGRQQGMEWVDDQKELFFQNANFCSALLFNPWPEVQDWMDRALAEITIPEATQTTIIAQAIGQMNAFDVKASAADRQSILQAGGILEKHFKTTLYHASFKLIQHLLLHPLSEVQNFGARILLHHQSRPEELPEELLLGLINGDIPELRTTGVELLGRLSDENLMERIKLIEGLCISPHPEIRKAVVPIVLRLTSRSANVGEALCQELAPWLLRKEQGTGRDEDLITLLTIHLAPHLKSIGKNQALNLLFAPRKAAHVVGSYYLHHYLSGADLSLRQIVKLGDNEMYAVREWVWDYYRGTKERILNELGEAVRLMDAKWEDSRDFAFDYFRTQLAEEDWTPDVIISICDSVHPMVQEFGKEMITRYFKAENGEQYLLQLSQHPSPALQQFASNYLERFAADQPDNIEQLRHYFYTVLSGVNKSRVAKKRIFAFLHQEAMKSDQSAQLVAEVMTRQSNTFSIEDKARCIQIMLALREAYPDLELPLQIKSFDLYPVATEISNQ